MVDRLTLRGILFWIWFAVELNSLTERTRRNETTTSNTSIWLWIFLPSSSVLYAAQQTFGSASVVVGSAASDSEQQQHLSSSGNSASQGRTTNTIVWRRRRCRWQRRQQLAVRCEQVEAEAEDVGSSSRCYAAVSSNANALPLRSGSLSLAATALSLSQRATEKERGIERGRAREFVWARSHKICLFWLSVRACKLCRAERRKAEQRSNCAARRESLLGLLVRAYSESLSA